MLLKNLVKLTNTYLAGEQLVYQKLVPFYDAVIDDINNRLNATFPAFSELDVDITDATAAYDAFPDQYLRSVVAIGAAHKFYMMDEEGITYDAAYEQEYEKGLFYMTRDYIEQVPEEYRSDSTGGVLINEERYVENYFPLHDCMWG